MSSMTWTRLILSSAMLHSISSVTPYYRIIWHCSGDKRVLHKLFMSVIQQDDVLIKKKAK
jgi:hypothetical protein